MTRGIRSLLPWVTDTVIVPLAVRKNGEVAITGKVSMEASGGLCRDTVTLPRMDLFIRHANEGILCIF